MGSNYKHINILSRSHQDLDKLILILHNGVTNVESEKLKLVSQPISYFTEGFMVHLIALFWFHGPLISFLARPRL